MKTLYIGIDEAGRGPWAGPLSVAGIATFDKKIFDKISDLNDSKKISAKKRQKIFEELKNLEKSGKIWIYQVFKSASEIDELWIRECNKQAMKWIISVFVGITISQKIFYNVLIDGSDNFDFGFPDFENIFAIKKSKKSQKIFQENKNTENCQKNNSEMWILCKKNFIKFIIGWDASESIISAASIIAKVMRDDYMERVSQDFPEYNFDKNKWYGTKAHHEAILNYGIKNEHRKTYEPIKTLISWDYWLL